MIILISVLSPEETPEKLLEVSKLNQMGWNAKISLKEDLLNVYNCYKRGIYNI